MTSSDDEEEEEDSEAVSCYKHTNISMDDASNIEG